MFFYGFLGISYDFRWSVLWTPPHDSWLIDGLFMTLKLSALSWIIAVLLGGTAFSGGEGYVARTIIGALIIMCVTTGLMTVIPAYWQYWAKGSVLIAAVVLNHLLVREKAQG